MDRSRILRNKALVMISSVLRTVAMLVATGTLMQTFLAKLGFSTDRVYLHTSVVQAVNMSVLFLGSRWVGIKNVISRFALISLPFGLLFLAYLPLCFRSGDPLTFYLLLGISILQAVTVGLRTVCEYTLPYILYPAEDYGRFNAWMGVFGSIVSIFLGVAVSGLVQMLPFVHLMQGAFIVAAFFGLGEAALTLLLRSILTENELAPESSCKDPEKAKPLSATLTSPIFYTLVLPTLLRGISSGLPLAFAALAFDVGFDERVTAPMVSLSAAAGLLACALIGALARRVSPRITILLGSLSFLLLPLVFSGSPIIFLAVATTVIFGKTFVDYGVPQILRDAVPAEIAGTYNSWRLILHTLGQFIATAIATLIPAAALVAVAMLSAVVSGVWFFFSRVLREADSVAFSRRS